MTEEIPAGDGISGYPEPRHRAAVLQLEPVHEECLPALVHLLRANHVEPTLYLNRRIRAERPGLQRHFPELAGRVRFVPWLTGPGDADALLETLIASDPDLVVFNTFQNPKEIGLGAQLAAAGAIPMLGVVHNSQRFRRDQTARRLVGEGRVVPLTLAPHVTGRLIGKDPELFRRAASITSTFPTPPVVEPVRRDGRTVAIPGGVNFRTRDYRQLLDALPPLKARMDAAALRFSVVGGGPDRAELRDLVVQAGADEVFEFVDLNDRGFVAADDYYAHLLGADLLLPLVPPYDASLRTYKITSAVPTSTGLRVPAVLDRWTATVYGDLPVLGHVAGEIGAGLELALAASDDDLAALRSRLDDHRERELVRSREELGWALHAVGLRS